MGRCVAVYPKKEKLSYSGFTIRGRIISNITSPFFVLTLIKSGLLKKVLKKDGRGTNISNLNQDILKKLLLPIPPLPEQKAIANLLTTWDDAIAKTKRLIELKEKWFQWIVYQLIFGNKRLNGKETKLNKGQFFNFPQEWNFVQIQRIGNEITKRLNNNSKSPVLSCSKYDGFVNSLEYFGKQVYSNDQSNYKVIKNGQFGYPSNHIEEGSIGLLNHCSEGLVSPIYVIFSVDTTKVYPPFLYTLLKTDIYRHIYQIRTSSSVDRRGSLRWNEFSKIKIPLPKIDEQKNIMNRVTIFKEDIIKLKKLVEKYKRQKQGLMQKLLAGTWRLKPNNKKAV